MMSERIKYFTPEPHYSVLEEHEELYIVGDESRAVVKEAEAITYNKSLPRWKRMAKVTIDTCLAWSEEIARAYDADCYIIPRNLRLNR
jgi:hypothetical protein